MPGYFGQTIHQKKKHNGFLTAPMVFFPEISRPKTANYRLSAEDGRLKNVDSKKKGTATKPSP